jgi:hypothetical protein
MAEVVAVKVLSIFFKVACVGDISSTIKKLVALSLKRVVSEAKQITIWSIYIVDIATMANPWYIIFRRRRTCPNLAVIVYYA